MHDLMNFLADWWLVALIILLAAYGLGALAGEISDRLRIWLWGERPKPRRYRITVEDYDGWPLRSYQLPAHAVGQLVRDLDRDKHD